MEKIIEAKGLSKSFSNLQVTQTVINNIDLEIYNQDFTVIMGSSGAGKSTLMYMLSGMDKPTSGRVCFLNEDITKYSDDQLAIFRRKNCGFVFQQIYLLDKMSLMDNALASALLVSNNKDEIIKKAEKLFEKVNITSTTWQKFPNQISGGEAQRAGIVRAIINKPSMLFADEPTGALNSKNSTAILDIFTDFNREGQSIIMVTHDKKSALRANRVLYLKDGKICGQCNLGKYKEDDTAREEKLNKFLLEMGW